MASYFDLPPQEKAAAANIEALPEAQRRKLGGMSLMSPAVTQLLEDLGKEESDSSSEEDCLSEEEDLISTKPTKNKVDTRKSHQNQERNVAQVRKPSSLSPNRSSSSSSPNRGSGHVRPLPTRPGGAGPPKQKPTQMARFHSLRSMLFQANIQDKMKTVSNEDYQGEAEAANKWKNQHEERQMHRPKTPEKDAQGKGGIGSRIRTSIRRMTSKEVPTMVKIKEDAPTVEFDDRPQVASSAKEDEQQDAPSKEANDGDEESIDHSDVEDLVRWVSRRDPPSDGEAGKRRIVQEDGEDSGDESLGNSDVEDLVRYVSRRPNTKEPATKEPVTKAEKEPDHHTGYSDASTESDSEPAKPSSDEDEDADNLMRWISHRDGLKAGPVRRNLEKHELDPELERHYDSDVPELGRWYKRYDGTSGESAASTPVKELIEEEERGRPRSRDSDLPARKEKNHLTNDDIDDLVKWVSRKDSKQHDQTMSENAERTIEWKRQEDAKKQVGMYVGKESLPHSATQDVDSTDPRDGLHQLNTIERDVAHFAGQEHVQPPSGESKQIDNHDFTMLKGVEGKTQREELVTTDDHRGSLGNEDVDELVKWISQKRP